MDSHKRAMSLASACLLITVPWYEMLAGIQVLGLGAWGFMMSLAISFLCTIMRGYEWRVDVQVLCLQVVGDVAGLVCISYL